MGGSPVPIQVLACCPLSEAACGRSNDTREAEANPAPERPPMIGATFVRLAGWFSCLLVSLIASLGIESGSGSVPRVL